MTRVTSDILSQRPGWSGAEIHIRTDFEGGSVTPVSTERADTLRVRLAEDPLSTDMHWFYFQISGIGGQPTRIVIENSNRMSRLAGRDDVPDCWTGYRPFASYDGETWFRCEGVYEDQIFSLTMTPEHDTVWFAYYPPYSMERHRALIDRALTSPLARLDVLGQTPDGHDLQMLRIAAGSGKPKLWIMGRQHPSETMAGFFMDGLLERLLDPEDALACHLTDSAEFLVIPTVNPDGCQRGLTRTNARGVNLNRAWAEPDPDLSPEVVMIRKRMHAEGVDFCLDVHGDEELPYVFLGGPLEIPSRTKRLDDLFKTYARAMQQACPAYHLADPYPGGPPDSADLRMAWNWVAEEFDCLSVLLEMPFKDTHRRPDPQMGWSPKRCHAFGRETLQAISAVVGPLRG